MAQSECLVSATVKVKKILGTACCYPNMFQWTPLNSQFKEQNKITLRWNMIRDQQVSSLSSPKAMIKLGLVNGSTIVLDFVHPGGLPKSFEVREKMKEMFISKLSASKPSLTPTSGTTCTVSEFKHRAALLASNPTLKLQHQETVNTGLVSEEDFWASRKLLLSTLNSKRQKAGKTSALLTDLHGKSENGNVVKYNLNAEIIHQIFIQYPAVHRAYKEQVPDKLSESEFWGNVFKSKYFHRDRSKGSAAMHDDIFSRYEAEERVKPKEKVEIGGFVDPLIDLTSSISDRIERNVNQPDHRNDHESLVIEKFNRHGAYVLDPNFSIQPVVGSLPRLYRDDVTIATNLDDLEKKSSEEHFPLDLDNERRYFEGYTQSLMPTMDQIPEEFKILQSDAQLANAFPSSNLALGILSDLVQKANSKTSDQNGNVAQVNEIPSTFKAEIYVYFHTICELLRHFWSFSTRSFSEENESKVDRIVGKIDEMYDQLQKMRNNLPFDQRHKLAALLKPFDDQLHLALMKREEQKRAKEDRMKQKEKVIQASKKRFLS